MSATMTTSEKIWSVPVRADAVPEGGRHIAIHADSRTRDALARAAGLLDLSRLDAVFDLARHGRDGLRVVGAVSAVVRQACVVTLDPVDNEVEEIVDLVFAPGHEAAASAAVAPDGTVDVSAPEPLVNGMVDLGAVATEFLMLGIDPYPRKPGAVFAPPAADGPSDHPFAALAALHKGKRDGDQ
jgi:Large ribosomal RNA subunit accumulation protein YceD